MRYVVAWLLVTGCASGGSSLIKGRVIDRESRSGVDNVTVMARSADGSSFTDVSNWNGEFDVQLPAGTYDVLFHHRNGTTGYRIVVPDASRISMEAVIQSSNVAERNWMSRFGKRRGDPVFWTRPTPSRTPKDPITEPERVGP